jgi:hypothetical protein
MSKKIAGFHMWHQRFLLAKGPPPGPPPKATGPSSREPDGWAAASDEINEDNVLWRQYVLLVDLYRYYIDLLWKVSIWFYTATGVCLA